MNGLESRERCGRGFNIASPKAASYADPAYAQANRFARDFRRHGGRVDLSLDHGIFSNGRDERKRKQHLYIRAGGDPRSNQFDRLTDFVRALPGIRSDSSVTLRVRAFA